MTRRHVLACASLLAFLAGCSASSNQTVDGVGTAAASSGGTPSTGGAAPGGSGGAATGAVGGIATGGAAPSGGAVTGGVVGDGGVVATGGDPGTGAAPIGGVAGTGGEATGGAGAPAGGGTGAEPSGGGGSGGAPTGGVVGDGGTGGSGGSVGGAGGTSSGGGESGGASGTGGDATGGAVVGPGSYALPPPSQCHNQDYIDYQEGCVDGDTTSVCGGKCNTINACLESSAEKPYADITFMCPRSMLFSDEMTQAAIDDGLTGFNYAVVGHDADRDGIDAGTESTCCECYQLVYAYPSPANERQCQANPDNPNPPASAIPIPKPLIVQSFNTAATPHTFDVYMAAGGLGANNACAPVAGATSRSGKYMYTAYPAVGQPGNGGVKPVTHFTECKTQYQWVTEESLSSAACQAKVDAACNEIASDIPGLTEQSRNSCIQSNDPQGDYHLNWSVYVMKVECPEHLTQVTGCKLLPQGLPAVDPAVTTAAQAAADSRFWDNTGDGNLYETTTMEDCCRPSCSSKDWVEGRGLESDPDYNAFYSCDEFGVPITEPE